MKNQLLILLTLLAVLIVPHFSAAISEIVLPRYSVWSSAILVITDAIEFFITFVGSSLPPRPVSSTTMSHFRSQKYINANAVICAKEESVTPVKSIASLSFSVRRIRSASEMFSPFILMRSLKRIIYGDVKSPTFLPDMASVSAIITDTEPLPFVPAI